MTQKTTYVVYTVHIIKVSSATNESRNPRAHCTIALRVVLAEGYLRIIPEFLPIILALFSNSQMYLLCSKLCWHNVSMPTCEAELVARQAYACEAVIFGQPWGGVRGRVDG